MTQLTDQFTNLMQQLSLPGKDHPLIRQALTHRSFAQNHNERLEFLGDSVLNHAITIMLFEQFPQLDEGRLSRYRAALVKESTLCQIAMQWHLPALMILGAGEKNSGGATRPSILADAVEALIGAHYLIVGFESTLSMIKRVYQQHINMDELFHSSKDAKTALQELLQRHKYPLPEYHTIATEGEDHQQAFTVICIVNNHLRTQGVGRTKRQAEQQAAQSALLQLQQDSPTLC